MSTQILVVEDDRNTLESITDLLQMGGYTVHTAMDGEEGILKAVLNTPDLILCDINMPGMSGMQMLDTMRNTRSLANIPLVFLTGQSDLQDQRRGMLLGADDYLTKPFTEDNLLQSIEIRLKRERQRKVLLQDQLNEQYLKLGQVTGHEYNTPLSGVIGLSTLLMNYYDDFDGEDTVTMLQNIRDCGFRLKRSLDNVHLANTLQTLTPSHPCYSSFTSGQTQISFEMIVNQFEQITGSHEPQLSWQIDIKEAQLGISSNNLEQILREVLDNGVKFSNTPGVISVTGIKFKTNYQLTVSNAGRYFKPEDIANIAPYRQFERNRYEQQGLGLGLALVKKLLDLNGGSLQLTSQPAGQTTVRMLLPLV